MLRYLVTANIVSCETYVADMTTGGMPTACWETSASTCMFNYLRALLHSTCVTLARIGKEFK